LLQSSSAHRHLLSFPTRRSSDLSPRAGVAILRAAQAWAMMEGRRQVLPEDVQAILPAVVGHRLHGNADAVKGSFDPAKELIANRSEEHTSELQSQSNLVCRLLLE